jgi:predicted phage terminase large subunit-like protein
MPRASNTKAHRLALNDADLLAIEREYCERSLLNFVRRAWPIVEPSRPFVDGWAVGAICEHLEAVTSGQITRLLITVPPGFMKSLTTSVFWPAWEWGPANMPHLRTVGFSYTPHLPYRDNRRMKHVITSDWYRGAWGDRVRIAKDQDEKGLFENTARGWMLASSIRGMGTGERGDRVRIDDPHNVNKAESIADREYTVRWARESASNRLNDENMDSGSAIVVIMQRVHERDVAGMIINELGFYDHLCLPMEFEPRRRCKTSIGFKDPRKRAGELAWPERFPRKTVQRMKLTLGTYGTAAQLQQRPAPRGGGMMKTNMLQPAPAPPESRIIARVRYWDKAATEGGGKRTAGVLIYECKRRDGSKFYHVADVVKGQWSAGRREMIIKATAEGDGDQVQTWYEREPGSGGKESAEITIQNLAGFRARVDNVSGQGDKETRADPLSAAIEQGLIYYTEGATWAREWIEELAGFPRGEFSDQVDATAGAYNKLARRKEWGVA